MAITSLERCATKESFPVNYRGKEAARLALIEMQKKHGLTATQGLIMYVCNHITGPGPEGRHLHLGRNPALR